MRKLKLIACLTLTSISACAPDLKTTAPINDWCLRDEPIKIDARDILVPETERQILAHDEIGQAVCGW